jgi:TolA-binding protein
MTVPDKRSGPWSRIIGGRATGLWAGAEGAPRRKGVWRRRAVRHLARTILAVQLVLFLVSACSLPAAWGDAGDSGEASGRPQAAPGRPAVARAEAASSTTLLQQAQTRLLDGNYKRAMEDFASLESLYPGTEEGTEALYRYGEAALADDQFGTAAEALRRFLSTAPDHPRRPVALLMLGRALEGQGDGGGAAGAYRQYVETAGGAGSVADVVHLRLAAIAFAGGRVAEGWAELNLAAAAAERSGLAGAKARVNEALGWRYLDSGNRTQTAAAWEAALQHMAAARRPERTSAELAWQLVGTYLKLGRPDQAEALRWRIVGEWPRTYPAWQAVTELGRTNVPASQRGLIAYSNRRWADAVEAYTTYLNAGAPEGRVEEARFQRAIALARLGNAGAVAALDEVAELDAHSQLAAEALWEAGSLLLRQGNRPAALARFERLAVGYPKSPRRGQALYWLGKLLPEQGQPQAAQRYLAAAADGGYEDFYTFRARAALKRPSPTPTPLDGQGPITASERGAWVEWLAGRGRPTETVLERRAQVEHDPRFQRGTTLLEAGFRKEAEEEFRELLESQGYDVVAVEHVAVHVRERGLYPYSVTLGHRLFESLNAMGETSILAAPRVVQKLMLPLAYLDLVAPAARMKGVDPLLMLGMIKQESWFEPRAASSANARGLTQFIFDTARAVANELQWPNWSWDDMNRPYVSVPFGAHYLGSLIEDFRGNYHFALAGYNGGPGNVLRWAKGDWNRDIDLFVEEITYFETRGYVKSVSGNYELYKAIYYR